MKLPSWPARTAAGFLLVCGALALVLATVGLFGVTFYTVSQRTREFGVRVALGATPGRVMALVLREGLMLTVPGVIAGIAGALLALRLASRMLVGVGPADPSTYVVTAVLQTAVALARVPAAGDEGDEGGSDARAEAGVARRFGSRRILALQSRTIHRGSGCGEATSHRRASISTPPRKVRAAGAPGPTRGKMHLRRSPDGARCGWG